MPDLLFDRIGRTPAIDLDHPFRLILRQVTICLNHALVECVGLFLQTIANFRSITQTRLRSAAINIEHEGEIRDAITYGKCIQTFDELRVEIARRTLINRGRVKKTIANHPLAPRQGRLNFLPDELTSTRFEGKQFHFRSHAVIFFGMLKQITAVISDSKTNIRNIEARTSNGEANIDIILDIADLKHLENIINGVRKIPGVHDVQRLQKI